MLEATGRGALIGLVFMLSGALMLAAKGIFAKILYARGLDPLTVVATRSLVALPGFVAIALARGGLGSIKTAETSVLVRAALAGLTCYYLGAGLNFYALSLIDASVERALLFSYPAMLVVWGWLAHGRRPRAPTTIATLATFVGIALTVGALNPALLEANALGASLVLICSATIAYYFLVSATLTHALGSAQFTVVAMSAAAAAFAVHFQWQSGWQHVDLDAGDWGWLLGLVVFATVLPLYLVAEGVRRIGAERAAIASTVGPVAATLMAFAFLGERIDASQLGGIALIVVGICVVELRRQRRSRPN